MGRFIDLTGQKFNKLTVIKFLYNNKYNQRIYLCKCDCGNETKVIASSLKSGHTKSCGKCIKFNDLTGQKFGRWIVIKKVENNKWGASQFLCQCDCYGKNSLKIIEGSRLNNGYSKSCGCLQKETASKIGKKYNNYDLSGEYGIGYTFKEELFYFDLEDYEKIKDYCWYADPDGYIAAYDIYNGNKNTRMHRLIMNCPDDMDVDHEFHNVWDNRKKFLRLVNRSQNGMNRIINSNNTSGVTGVHFDNTTNKWQARIQKEGKRFHLGSFDNFQDAVEVRKQAEIEYFGEYRYIGDCYQEGVNNYNVQ